VKFYNIKPGYKCNLDEKNMAIPYNHNLTDPGSYQVVVYKYAAEIIKKRDAKVVYTSAVVRCTN
jgi:hypothetical protein